MKPVTITDDGTVKKYLSGPVTARTFEHIASLDRDGKPRWYRISGRVAVTEEQLRTMVRLIAEEEATQ